MLGAVVVALRLLEASSPVESPDSPSARREDAVQLLFVAAYGASLLVINLGLRWAAAAGWGRSAPILWLQATTLPGRVVFTLLYLFVLDLFDYGWHRACHAVPLLWRLHSFHHSATHLSVLAIGRESWLAPLVSLPLRLAVGALICIDPQTLLLSIAVTALPPRLSHMNLKVPWRGLQGIVVTPQWHRVHHSTLPEHQGKNFAILFPVIDRLFGTAHVPAADEYPPTGLAGRAAPGMLDGLIWPFLGPAGRESRDVGARLDAELGPSREGASQA